MADVELTILMPCLNEAETLRYCIERAQDFLSQAKVTGEILIADNGSQDGSEKIAANQGARVVSVAQRGYGAALRSGIAVAQGRYIIMGDADGSYDFTNLHPILRELRKGYDLVMGNRFRGGIKPGAMPWLNKYIGNPVLSTLGKLFFKAPIGDFHCGLRGLKRDSFLALDLQSSGMEFASEMVVKAMLHGLRVTEVPTTLSPDGRSRAPHLRPWRDGWRHLRLLLLFSPRWLFLYPGLALFTIGSLLMILLTSHRLHIGHAYLDIHTLLFASLFLITGLQAIFFAELAQLVTTTVTHPLTPPSLFWRVFTLERGLLLGGLLLALGCYGSLKAFLFWLHHDFGPLIPAQMMRHIIPSFTFVLTGVQIIVASFFAGVMRLNVQTNPCCPKHS